MVRSGIGRWLAAMILAAASIVCGSAAIARPTAGISQVAATELPQEVRAAIERIRKGSPPPFERDGMIFGNREKRLPVQARGYYREYTVKTPGVKGRGARRIVAGRGGELFYTDDHYQSFRRIKEP